MATINGTIFSDSGIFAIQGTSGNDTIYAYGGHDDVFGNGGDDTIYGDDGNDSLHGGAGNDTLYGGDTQDFLFGGDGNDVLVGGGGSTNFDDFMEGGRGNDTYYVDEAGDVVNEVAGESDGIDRVRASISYTLTARVENLTLQQGAGSINGTGNGLDNEIIGNSNNNTLIGLDGSDTLNGGGGADTMRGGTGHDFYHVDNTGDVVTENANEGFDTVNSTISYTLGTNLEDLVLQGTGAIDGTGNTLDNTIVGNGSGNELRGLGGEDLLKGGGGDDTLRGGDEDDELYGESGNDILRGDGGDDEMYGGTGDDDYFVNSVGDVVSESANQGVDTVFIFGLDNYTLDTNFENLVLVTGDNGTGNTLNNNITGNLLDNLIDGRSGQDTMEGGQGDDTYIVDNANDVVIESAGTNQGTLDTVRTSVSYALLAGSQVEVLETTNQGGTAPLELTGNEFNNTIRGNNGSNVITGGAGADTLLGDDDADTFVWRTTEETGVAVATMDVISDFSRGVGDRIDLSRVDANVFANGNQQFVFIGQNAFSGTPGEVNFVHLNGDTIIQLQTGTSADVEGSIRIPGIHTPDASWFVL